MPRDDVPITGLDFHALHDSNAILSDTDKGNDAMPRAKKSEGSLEAITARRAAIEAELVELAEAERRAREAERDAGRDVFLGALGKVKIGRMDRSEATAIAKAIEKHGAEKVVAKLASIG